MTHPAPPAPDIDPAHDASQDGAESVPPPQWRPEPAIAMMLDLAHDLKRANAQLTAERDRARDLAAALEAELAKASATLRRHYLWADK